MAEARAEKMGFVLVESRVVVKVAWLVSKSDEGQVEKRAV